MICIYICHWFLIQKKSYVSLSLAIPIPVKNEPFGQPGQYVLKKIKYLLSYFWGLFNHVFMGKKLFVKFSVYIVTSALKSWIKEKSRRGKYFPSNSSWFPRDLKVVPYFFFKKSLKSKKLRPSNIQLLKLRFHGGPSFFDFQLFYQQKFSGKEIEYGLAAIIQL